MKVSGIPLATYFWPKCNSDPTATLLILLNHVYFTDHYGQYDLFGCDALPQNFNVSLKFSEVQLK